MHGIQKSSPTTTCDNNSPVTASASDKADIQKINSLFESYRDNSSFEDAILVEGMERFCLDLEVDPAEFIVLAIAWKFKAETMCQFTRYVVLARQISLYASIYCNHFNGNGIDGNHTCVVSFCNLHY